MDSSHYEQGIGKARKSFGSFAEGISAKSIAIGKIAADVVEKAARAAVDLGKSAIQAAADVTAENAQFEATFGTLQGEAKKAFNSIGKETGILSTRLRTVGTKAFAQFKGAGLDAGDALGMMETYTTLAADAAAYYDITIEEADAKLRSFLRGNTEAGDAIGLFTSEAQRNTYAVEKYGKKWKDLTEAQKQMLMLDVANDIYEQSGAIGQAARESDSWANIIGNLQEAWRQALGWFGQPIVNSITPMIESLTSFLNDEHTQTMFAQFGLGIADIANAAFDKVQTFFDTFGKGGEGEGVTTAIGGIAQSMKDIAGLVLDNVIKFIELLIGGPDGMDDTITNIEKFFTDVGTFIEDHKQPITDLITALLALWAVSNPFALILGALALLIGNWEDVKQWTIDAIAKFDDYINKPIPSTILSAIITAWGEVVSWIDAAIAGLETFAQKMSKQGQIQGIMNIQDGYNQDGIWGMFQRGWDEAWWNPKNWGNKKKDGDFGGGQSDGDGGGGRSFSSASIPALNTAGADVPALSAAVASAVRDALDGVGVYMGADRVGDLITARVSGNIMRDAKSRRYG